MCDLQLVSSLHKTDSGVPAPLVPAGASHKFKSDPEPSNSLAHSQELQSSSLLESVENPANPKDSIKQKHSQGKEKNKRAEKSAYHKSSKKRVTSPFPLVSSEALCHKQGSPGAPGEIGQLLMALGVSAALKSSSESHKNSKEHLFSTSVVIYRASKLAPSVPKPKTLASSPPA